jgi:UDP-N-acetylglucosamine 3-dehydrogenase
MLKVAILGFGFAGKTHADAYARLSNVRLVAVGGLRSGRGERAWKAPYPVKFYPDPDILLNSSGADIVDICLPTFMHEEFVLKAAEKGMHIICEKPFALSLTAVDRMLEAVGKEGVTLMVAQVLRFFPHYRKCRELMQAGQLGNVFFASASRLSELPRWADWFRDPQKSGGALFDLQVHDLDYLLNLLGIPEGVFATGLQSESGAWNHVVTLLAYSGKKVCTEASYRMAAGWPFTSRLRLMGTDASLEYEFRVHGNVDMLERAKNSLTLYAQGGATTDVEVEDCDPYLSELKYFVDTIEKRQRPQLVPPEEARNVIGVLEAAKRSLETGKTVELAGLLAKA